MKIDGDKKLIKMSVKDLVFAQKNHRNVRSSLPLRIRASRGTELHQTYQDKLIQRHQVGSRDITNEAYIKLETEVAGWRVFITGRADCVIEEKNQIFIEEVKTVADISRFVLESEVGKEFSRQLQLYAHFYGLQVQNKEIFCNLIIIDMYTENLHSFPIPYTDQTLFIRDQLRSLIDSWKGEEKEQTLRKARETTFSFPFDTFRLGQEQIIQQVQTTMVEKGRLLLSAPSGLGKTAGSLYPALLHCVQHDLRLFVVTSKTTQQQIYFETLRIMAEKQAKFHAIVLTAKEKLCLNDSYDCDVHFCSYLEGYNTFDLENEISLFLQEPVFDARFVRKMASKYHICPFELALDLSLYCDVIVGDYNYVFSPQIRLRRFFDEEYDDCALIVDEAHNLPARAREYYSPSLTGKELEDLLVYLDQQRLSPSLSENGKEILMQLKIYLRKFHQYRNIASSHANTPIKITSSLDLYAMKAPPKEVTTFPSQVIMVKINKQFINRCLRRFDEFILRYSREYIRLNQFPPPSGDALLVFSGTLRQFQSILGESESPEFSHLFYPHTTELKIFCKSAAEKLAKQMQGFYAVIAQSATLFPAEYYIKMLGFPDTTQACVYPSPFSRTNRLYLDFPHISTKYQDRDASYDVIAQLISAVMVCHKGNYLAFFPSFSYMHHVIRELEMIEFSPQLLIQEANMSERKRRDFLKALKISNKQHLLLGVHGGIFSEGVDFEGDMAIGVFIIGLGLPTYCLEQELMKNYFEMKWKRGFEYAYRNVGMTRVIQAAGRIFRTPTDKGVVIFICERFRNPYYAQLLPSDWIVEKPPNMISRIQEFWKLFVETSSGAKKEAN